MTRPDAEFSDPRLAAIYDDVDGPRDDLDLYVSIASDLGARSVLDLGCGTGSLAIRLAALGLDVTGVDPADASLDVARSKPGAHAVRWVLGDAGTITLDASAVDLVTMTGNVAQVFVGDDAWRHTLTAVRRRLAPGGRLVFETRDPTFRDWESWDTAGSTTTVTTSAGNVSTWTDVLDVREFPELIVTFRNGYRFADGSDPVVSTSRLRFRSMREIRDSLDRTGFTVDEVRDAPDRPGREFVVIASRHGARPRRRPPTIPGLARSENRVK